MNLRMLGLPLVAAAALVAAPRTAAAEIKACKTGMIFAGNPKYSGQDRPPATGGNIRSDPALGVRSMVFKGKTMYTTNGEAVWAVDLGSGALRRVAGDRQTGALKFNDGACDAARFHNLQGITLLPDGSIVGADFAASALVKISSPDDPGQCKVSYYAGSNKPFVGNATTAGDVDGPADANKLNWPQWPVADAGGNVYVIDSQTSKLRKVAPDRSVTTVASLPHTAGQSYRGLTLLKDKLYAVHNSATSGIVSEIDPATGKVRKVFEGTYKQFVEIPAGQVPTLAAITNDGTNLFITGQGYIWRLTPAGKITHVAGKGSPADLPKSYDVKAPHPAKELLLRIRQGDTTSMGTLAALAHNDGALYFRGREDGVYVVKIDCR